MNKLDEIEKTDPPTASFVAAMRVLAGQFQFEVMGQQLNPENLP